VVAHACIIAGQLGLMLSFVRRNRESAYALLAAVAFFTALCLIRHDTTRLRPYLQVAIALVLLTALADRVAHFSRPMVAALTSVAIVHLVGGLMTPIGTAPTFYETWLIDGVLKFDQVAHMYGTAVLTFASARIVIGVFGGDATPRRPVGLSVVAALMACGMGGINELVEFLFGLHNPNLHAGGLENTGWDLAFNLAGSVVAGVLLVLLADPHQVDDEHERLVRRDDAAGALAAVAEVRRDR
jgi:hypothetical protein